MSRERPTSKEQARKLRARRKIVYSELNQNHQRQARERARLRMHRRTQARRIGGGALIAVGAVVALTHMVAHLMLSATSKQDILVGYPTAGALIVLGFAVFSVATRSR